MRVVTIFRGIHKLCPEFLLGHGCLSAAAAFGFEKDQIRGINRGTAYFKTRERSPDVMIMLLFSFPSYGKTY